MFKKLSDSESEDHCLTSCHCLLHPSLLPAFSAWKGQYRRGGGAGALHTCSALYYVFTSWRAAEVDQFSMIQETEKKTYLPFDIL